VLHFLLLGRRRGQGCTEHIDALAGGLFAVCAAVTGLDQFAHFDDEERERRVCDDLGCEACSMEIMWMCCKNGSGEVVRIDTTKQVEYIVLKRPPRLSGRVRTMNNEPLVFYAVKRDS
jgi:hypothetical protein